MPRPRPNESPLRLHRRFHSRGLRNNRDIVVWLPPGYGMIRGRRHPVVYFQDGQNIFDPLTAFLAEVQAVVIPFERDHWAAAADAFRRFGKGRHAAALTFGDCLAYATAKVAGEPLLCKGDDFAKTDLRLA